MDGSIRSVGETLTEGMALLGRVWRRLIPPSFGAFIVLGAATLAIFKFTGANDFIDLAVNNPSAVETIPTDELAEILNRFLTAVGLSTVLQVIAYGFVSLAAYHLVAMESAGEQISAGQASAFATRRIVTFLIAALVAATAVVVGLVLLVVPGIWLAGRLAVTAPVIGFERVGAVAALRRSSRLVKGHWWPTVGFLILVGLLGTVAGSMVQLVALPLLAVGSVGLGTGLVFAVTVVVQGFIVAAIGVMGAAWYRNLTAQGSATLSAASG